MKLLLAIALAAGVPMARATPTAVTNALTRVNTADITENSQTLASTNWTDGLAAHPAADYLISRRETIRTPNDAFVFHGNSLQLGTDAQRAELAQKPGELTFANDGLFLKNATWTHWAENCTARVNGRVTVLSKKSRPVVFTNTATNDKTGIAFTGDWQCAADCGVKVSPSAPSNTYRLVLSGDLNGYRGEIRVESNGILAVGSTRCAGEIHLSGGRLEAAAVGDVSETDTLTLDDGSELRFQIKRKANGDLAHSALRVAKRLDCAGVTVVQLPDGVVAFCGREERRLTLLTLSAAAEGALDAARFRLAAANGLRLEVSAGRADERTLDVVFPAVANPAGALRYEDFGAVGDGVADDMDAIVATHAAANALGMPVRARDEATYRIVGLGKTARIETDVDFGTARVVIDDSAVVSSAHRNVHVFRVASAQAAITLGGVERIVKGRHALGVRLPCRCLVEAVNANKKQFIRTGSNQNDGSNQQEMFLADADGTLDRDVPMLWDFAAVTSLKGYPIDEEPLTVRGGVFETVANAAESAYNYYKRGISVERSNVRIVGMRHEISGEGDHGAPYGGFIDILRAARVVVTGCVFTAHKTYKTIGSAGVEVSMGSYDVRVNNSVDVTLTDCRQTTSISNTAYWGVFTSNFSKNLAFEGCALSRFDAHQGVANATIRNSEIGHMAIKAIGTGTLLVENTDVYANSFIELRGDYGSTWDGEFVVRNCRYHPNPKSSNKVILVTGSNAGNHDYGYPCTMPRRVTIDGLRIDDANHYSTYTGPFLFANFNSANTGAAYREEYPYGLTEKVVLRNVAVASGKAVQVSPNAWMFRKVEITGDPPTDVACALDAPAVGWNWTNVTVSATVSAFDAEAVRDGRLVLTVRDSAGRVVTTAERPVIESGAATFALALPRGGRDYRYELAAYDGERKLACAETSAPKESFAGSFGGDDWFASSAADGTPRSVNGEWTNAPSVNAAAKAYAIKGVSAFAVDDREPSRRRKSRVELTYTVDELICPGTCAPFSAAAVLAAFGDGMSPASWRALRRNRFGDCEWVVLEGHRPELGKTYDLRIETDFTVTPPQSRYFVREAGGGAFTALRDGDGADWQAAGDERAETVSAVGFEGFGTVRSFAGRVGDAAVAETGGVRYDDLNAALAAGAAHGTTVTLLADVAFQPDHETGGVDLLLAGHRLKWRDGDGYALARDPATGRFRALRLNGPTPPNGIDSYSSYALGLDAADPGSKPLATLELRDGAVHLALAVPPPSGTGATLAYRLMESDSPTFADGTTSPAQTSPHFTLPVRGTARFYRLLIDVTPPQ